MGRYFFLVGLWICSAAYAAAWMPIGTSGNSRFDIDMDSIERSGKQVKAWFRENTMTRQRNPVGRYYRSVVTLEVFECAKRTMALEKAVYYSSPDKAGSVVGDFSMPVTASDFSLVVPGSIGEIKLERACAAHDPVDAKKTP